MRMMGDDVHGRGQQRTWEFFVRNAGMFSLVKKIKSKMSLRLKLKCLGAEIEGGYTGKLCQWPQETRELQTRNVLRKVQQFSIIRYTHSLPITQ